MKWACSGMTPKEKWRMQQLQTMLGSEHELHVIPPRDSEWEKALEGFGHIRFGEAIQVAMNKVWPVQSTWTALLGITDGMILREGRWWPLCASYEALVHTVTSIGEGLDMQASAFISGTCGTSRAAVGALFRSGFRKFRIVATDEARADEMVKDIRAKFFGMDLEIVPPQKIVLLAGVSSVFVNTLVEEEAPELAKEISYLNFLKRPGAILDTTLYSKQTVLLKESTDSQIPTVDGWAIAARIDALWAEWAFKKQIDVVAYEKLLRDNCANSETPTV